MGEVNAFEDEELYGLRIDFEQRKGEAKEELQKAIDAADIPFRHMWWIFGESL